MRIPHALEQAPRGMRFGHPNKKLLTNMLIEMKALAKMGKRFRPRKSIATFNQGGLWRDYFEMFLKDPNSYSTVQQAGVELIISICSFSAVQCMRNSPNRDAAQIWITPERTSKLCGVHMPKSYASATRPSPARPWRLRAMHITILLTPTLWNSKQCLVCAISRCNFVCISKADATAQIITLLELPIRLLPHT